MKKSEIIASLKLQYPKVSAAKREELAVAKEALLGSA